jgi:hypothetical protein
MEKGGLELVRWTKQHINYIHQFIQGGEKDCGIYQTSFNFIGVQNACVHCDYNWWQRSSAKDLIINKHFS